MRLPHPAALGYEQAMEPPDEWQPLAEMLLGKPEYAPIDVARETDFSLEELRRLWRALGFPPVPDDARVFTRSEIEVLRTVRQLIERQGTQAAVMVQLTRVTGQSLARIADAQVTEAAGRFLQRTQEASGEVARSELISRIQVLVQSFDTLLSYVWRRHVLAAVLRLSVMPSPADRELTIGFADLVGFTAMSQALDAHELAAMVDRFEAIAYDHIVERGGRVVKMIGDEVMFAVDDGVAAAEIGLALVEAHAREKSLPDARVGLACGPTLAWEGDLFGPTVNLASRLVNVARPRALLASEELGERLRELPQFTLRHLRAVNLQGIGRVRSWVVRRAE
jgi:adenylate cyclase